MMFKRLTLALGCLLLSILPLQKVCAVDIVWDGTSGAKWSTAANWDAGTVPTDADTAVFRSAVQNQINIDTGIFSVGSLRFDAGGSADTINIADPGRLRIDVVGGIIPAAGITNNNVGNTQTIRLTGINPRLIFRADAAISGLGQTHIINNSTGTGTISFNNDSNAGNAIIENKAQLTFTRTSNAGSAVITNTGTVNFKVDATGSGATIHNNLGGTLDISGSNAGVSIGRLTGDGTVALGIRTLTLGGLNETQTINGVISGPGGGRLIKTGTVNLTLGAANSYTGGTTITGGTITVNNDTALGLAAGPFTFAAVGTTLQAGVNALNLANNVILTTAGTVNTLVNTLTLGGQIQGQAGRPLTKAGAGTLILPNNNTYLGGTIFTGGTIEVRNSAALGVGAFTFFGGGTTLQAGPGGLNLPNTINLTSAGTVNTLGNTLTLGGQIQGLAGSPLAKSGTGTLILPVANAYLGGTIFTGGTIAVLNNASLGLGTFTFNGGGTLQARAGGLNLLNAITLTTTGTVDTNTHNLTLGGNIGGGSGLIKINPGTLILSGGVNNYIGPTTVTGGTLQGTVPTNTALTVTNPGTFNLTANRTVGSLAGTGAVTLHGFTLTAGGNGNDTTYSGQMTGAGGYTKEGNGTQTFAGLNIAYTGPTMVNNGTIQGPLPINTALSVEAAGTYNLTAPRTIGSLAGAGAVTLNGNTLTAGGNGNNTLYNGQMTGVGGFIKLGNGTQTFAGSNIAYFGPTTVTLGTLQGPLPTNTALTVGLQGTYTLTENRTIGSLTGPGTVTLNANTLTTGGDDTSTNFSGFMAGTGGLTKEGIGIFTLSGGNKAYTGPTTVNNGTLQGSLPTNTALTVTFPGKYNLNASRTIGSLAGSGAVTLNANTLTAGGNANNTLYTGTMAGTGGLTKEGTGTFTLGGLNNYQGPTTINNGTLTFTGDTSGLGGNIVNGSALVFNQAADSSFNQVISGVGTVTQQGPSNLTLSNNNTYTGATSINGGALTNNGTLTSPIFVNAGGTYRGTGSTTGALTNNGTVAPGIGSQIGTLKTGNYTGTGELQIQLTPEGSNDLLAVNGTAMLTNTNLELTTFGSTNKTFTILTATGGLGGATFNVTATGGLGGTQFSSVALPPGLVATIQYLTRMGTGIVQLISTGTDFASFFPGQRGNAAIVARYLDRIDDANTESPDLITVLTALSNAARQGTGILADALNQISPELYRESSFLSLDQANLVNQSINTQQQRILDRFVIRNLELDNVPSTSLASFQNHLNTRSFRGGIEPIRPTAQYFKRPQKGVPQLENALAFNGDNLPVRKTVQAGHSSIWIEPYGQTARKKNSYQHSSPLVGTKSNAYGMTLGGDTRVAPNTYVGILGGIMNTHFDWTQSRGKGRVSGYYGGAYALWLSKPGFYVDGQVIVGGNKYHTRRNINFQNINRTARERHSGLSVSTDAEVGYLWTCDKTVIQPFFNYAYVAVHESSFNETGAMSLNIHSPSKTSHFSRMELGPIVSHFFVCGETLIYPSLKLSWVQKRPLGSGGKNVKFNFTDQSTGTTVFGDNRVQNLIAPAISLTAQFKEGLYVTGDINGEFGKNDKLGQAMLTFGYNF